MKGLIEGGPARCATIGQAMLEQATRRPGQVGFTLVGERGSVAGELTYGGLAAAALQAAARLRDRGLRRGDRVLVCLPTGEEILTAIYGVMLAGGVCVPVYPPSARQGFDHWRRLVAVVARVVQPWGAVVAVEHRLPMAALLEQAGHGPAVIVPADLQGGAGVDRPVDLAPEDLALVQFTSGTTQQPRGVAVSHGSLLANVAALFEVMPLSAADVSVSWLPPYHDMGLVGHIFMPVYCGVRQVLMPPSRFWQRPETWLQLISDERATQTTAPNSGYSMCVQRVPRPARRGLDLSSLRWALNGAEPVQAATLARFARAFGPCGFSAAAFRPVYGLAEATLAATFSTAAHGPRVDWVDRQQLAASGRATPRPVRHPDAQALVSVGQPLPGHSLQIVRHGVAAGRPGDGSADVCAERQVGEIWLRGPSVTGGYFNNPQASVEVLREGWLRTGDLGYLAGGELFVTGRGKELIVRRGRKHLPQDLEQACFEVPGLRPGRAVAFGTVDQRDGTEHAVIVAEVRERAGAGSYQLAVRVADAVARATGLRPDRVELVTSGVLPKTTSGKLQRSRVKQAYEAGETLRAPSARWLDGLAGSAGRSVLSLASTRTRRFFGWQ